MFNSEPQNVSEEIKMNWASQKQMSVEEFRHWWTIINTTDLLLDPALT